MARISPRHLGGATRIHYTTIYRLLKSGDDGMFPIHVDTITQALDKIDALVAAGKLPIEGKLLRTEKTRRLAELLTEHN